MSIPKGYVDSEYLQLLETQMMGFKRKSYECMNIKFGDSVLDVGCGPGSDTIHLAKLVDRTGEVVGIDYDADMVALANQRALACGLGNLVKHKQGEATSLPFNDAYFDSSRSERLFQHLFYPEHALFEMARVTKPNGWVVVMDTDWGTLSINSSLPEIERRIIQFSNEHCLNNGYSGRRLAQLFHRYSLKDIFIETLPYQITNHALARKIFVLDKRESESLAAGVITKDELNRWNQDLDQLQQTESFFASLNLMLVAGRV